MSTGATSTGGGGDAGTGCQPVSPVCMGVTDPSCVAFTPADTGAGSTGKNACDPHYALSPSATPNGKLVLYLNGSGGHPANATAHAFVDTAASLGYAVLALSYRSDTEIAMLCAGANADKCYLPTRKTLILGVLQQDAAMEVQDIQLDEGIVERTVLALKWLGQHDSAYPWDSFLESGGAPEDQIDWSKVAIAGHSQGGGHATAIGMMFPAERVLQFSAPCDKVGLGANGKPATWLNRSQGTWMTPSSVFWGLGLSTDTTCPIFAAAWQALEMSAAQSDSNAQACPAADGHGASIACVQNKSVWKTMLQ